MNELLILCAGIMILCIVFSKLSVRIGMPALVVFLLLGMAFGSDGFFQIHFDDYALAENVSYLALIFIMFYGGFCLNLKAARPFVAQASLLATAGIVISALALAAICHALLPFSWLESFLIASVLASTDAASVFSILRMKKLNLKAGLAPILEMESGSNDPFAYLLTMIALSLLSGSETSIFFLSLQQILLGIGSGILIAGCTLLVFRFLKIKESGLNSILLAAFVILAYAFASLIKGNGFLSVYLCGVILGNCKLPQKAEQIHFFDSISSMMQIVLFFMLGLLSFPSQLPDAIFSAVIIFLALTFFARPIAVFLCLIPFSLSIKEKLFLSWCGLRGAASIVFAIVAVLSPAYTDFDIFHIVMIVSLLSITLQGMLLPKAAKWLNVIDESNDTSRTFNDYLEETAMQLIHVQISRHHPWIDKTLQEIEMPPEMIAVLLKRGNEAFVPDGATKLLYHDHLVLVTTNRENGIQLEMEEIPLSKHKQWIGSPLADMDTAKFLIILIRRNDDYFVPDGTTILQSGDVLIACERDVILKPEKEPPMLAH